MAKVTLATPMLFGSKFYDAGEHEIEDEKLAAQMTARNETLANKRNPATIERSVATSAYIKTEAEGEAAEAAGEKSIPTAPDSAPVTTAPVITEPTVDEFIASQAAAVDATAEAAAEEPAPKARRNRSADGE